MIILESFNPWFSILDQTSTQAVNEEREDKLRSQFNFSLKFYAQGEGLVCLS